MDAIPPDGPSEAARTRRGERPLCVESAPVVKAAAGECRGDGERSAVLGLVLEQRGQREAEAGEDVAPVQLAVDGQDLDRHR